MSTSVLATDTTNTWVVYTGASGQDRPTAAATIDTAQITFTAGHAMNTGNTSAQRATVLGCDQPADTAIMAVITKTLLQTFV